MIITLEGFMGCGKSSVGRELAVHTGWEAYDLDSYIVLQQGQSIAEIFATKGEAKFREIETACLQNLLKEYEGGDLIIALGGGTPLLNFSLLKEKTFCIWLRASYETILRHIGTSDPTRPLYNGDIRARLEQREPIYKAAAHHIIDVDGLHSSIVAQQILKIIQNRQD
ncbi:MAG: shikimate kinase [Bacteroidales bacterium]|nr:shikimate kinase [Bacteroidales bacterium]